MVERKPVTGVKGIVYDPDSQSVLLLTRSKNLLPGRVDFPGGEKEKTDASDEAAMLRELQEELGLSDEVMAQVRLIHFATTHPNLAELFPDIPMLGMIELTLVIFIVEGITESTEFVLKSDEISQVFWGNRQIVERLAASKEMLPVLPEQVLKYLDEAS